MSIAPTTYCSFSAPVKRGWSSLSSGLTEAFKNTVTYVVASTVYLPTHGQRTAEIMREEGWDLVSSEASDSYSDEDTTTTYRCPDGGLHKTSSTYYQAARATAATQSRTEIRERIFPTSANDFTV